MNKKSLFIIINPFLLLAFNLHSQQHTGTIVCNEDTVTVQQSIKLENNTDSLVLFDAVRCERSSRGGFRIDIGFVKYYYNKNTKQWLGNYGSPLFAISILIQRFNFGLRFKPFTVNPQTELIFYNDTLFGNAILNPIKTDYYLGYSFDYNHNFSLEPYLGYSQSSFIVINQDELNKTYNIPQTNGVVAGITLNKYFNIKDYEYFNIFVSCAFTFIDYRKVHNELGFGNFEWMVGLSYKGFVKKHFLEPT